MNRNNPPIKTILSAGKADGVGSAINIKNYKNNEVMIDTDGASVAECDLYILVSYQKDAPTFSAAQSLSNSYFKVGLKDLDSQTVYAGSTGIGALLVGNDLHRGFNAIANNPVWICAEIDNYVAGEITIRVKSNNDA